VHSRLPKRDLQLSSVDDLREHRKIHADILNELREAEQLRHIKNHLLQFSEKRWIDRVLSDATNAIQYMTEPIWDQKGPASESLSITSDSSCNLLHGEEAKDRMNRMMACRNALKSVLDHLDQIKTPIPTIVHEMGGPDVKMVHELESNEDILLKHEPGTNDQFGMKHRLEVNLLSKEPLYNTQDFSGLEVVSKIGPDPLDQEMSDMLAWRRSKGSRSYYPKKPGLVDSAHV
jgi:hypothetical protein